MLANYTITKAELIAFLKEVSKAKTLIAPVKNEFDEVLLLPVDDVNRICFDYQLTLNSAKDYFLPSSEPIFICSKRAGKVKIRRIDDEKEIFIFGLRSCDTKAVELLDKFFKRKFEDNLYLKKRKSALLMTLVCTRYWEDCFCDSTNTGMILNEGFDVQLIPLNKDKYLLQVGSKEAEFLLKDLADFLSPFSEEEKEKLMIFKSRLEEHQPKFDLKKVYLNLKNGKVEDNIWQDIASRCQRCGLCMFICPSCSCFTVLDRRHADDFSEERTRQWDACYFKGFTRLAGGENPVKTDENMIKRKYVHKLVQQLDEFGISGCTGCGRCVKCCVGNVDWLKNITKMQ